MPTVSLTEQEWSQLVALLANNCVWAQANPLLMKIGQQLEALQRQAAHEARQQSSVGANSESSEQGLDRRS